MLSDDQILTICGNELIHATGGNDSGYINGNREHALATYLGQPDGKEVEGRSKVISTDVADAIEWIMPEIVKAFTQNNEVVTFDPTSDGDEDQAELESQYVYDILMKENNGFIILHQFIKDMLMQKNGFIKTYFDENIEKTTEEYTDIIEPEYEMLLADEEVEIQSMTESVDEESGLPLFSCKIERTTSDPKINVVSVPPEEFRVNRLHNSVDVSDARFTAHVMLKTAGDLVQMGFDRDFIDEIPSSEVFENDREYRFYIMGEEVGLDDDISGDPALRPLEIAECCMRMDIDEDGIAERVKVLVAGGNNPTHLLSVEPLDSNPFISSTAILMSHKMFGLSIYDRLRQIQEQKTTLWRNILDNMYLQNNQRTIVVEGQVKMDDLLVSRPGGVIRVKRLDALQPFVTPPLGQDAFSMMNYLDQVRAGRSGVSPEGAVNDVNIGDNVGSQGVERLMSSKEELVGLMIRVIAETGIKPLCYKIREEARKNPVAIKPYLFRGQWQEVDPSKWDNRTNTTVRVGTGSGNRKEQLGAITQIMNMQAQILANPSQSLVRPEEIFSAANDFAKFSGMPSVRKYLLDPKSPEGKEHRQKVDDGNKQRAEAEQKEKQVMAEATAKIAEAEASKAKTAEANVQLKGQIEFQKNQAALQKQALDNEIALLKNQVDEAKILTDIKEDGETLEFKYEELREKIRVEELRIEQQAKAASDNNKDKSDGPGKPESKPTS